MAMLIKNFRNLFIITCLLSSYKPAIATDTSWIYTTMLGQILKVEHMKDERFSLAMNDITVRVDSCGRDSDYKVCLLSNFLDLAIPKHRPELGQSWKVRGTEFALQQILKELSILNNKYSNIYVIDVKRVQKFYLPNSDKIKFSRLFYSYETGLLAFQELDENRVYDVTFFSSMLPSLGQ